MAIGDRNTGEVSRKEVEYILALRSNDPAIGYNRWPKFKFERTRPSALKRVRKTRGSDSGTLARQVG